MRQLILFVISLILIVEANAADHPNVVIILNAQNPTSKLKAQELRDYYFKRKRTWDDGTAVRFIEAGSSSALRRNFVTHYLKKSPSQADTYWIGQKLYSGDSAPLQQSSEVLIIQFVASFKGAIGYVSASTPIKNKSVKVVKIE